MARLFFALEIDAPADRVFAFFVPQRMPYWYGAEMEMHFEVQAGASDFQVGQKVRLTGRKLDQKQYFRHTGYMGHERYTAARDMLATHPERVIEKAVFGMLPKNSLARQKLRGKLKVYAGPEHPHAAQQPRPYSISNAKVSA